MLLARKGLNVLVIDRARFPSHTLSSHQLQPPGAARLRRWGLLDALEKAGTPPAREVRFRFGDVVLRGAYPSDEALYSAQCVRSRSTRTGRTFPLIQSSCTPLTGA
jgi:2-polyprenyl-6-methoxyphenol hydroxylase-like FAD-dependent oxidoreductase